ncbi:MAG: TetR family transcriptional regulator [Pseudomonadaceae bacterium]|nr:TetR family transcriptional regulator [Pseudomonadaceae bacterium]
MTSTAKPIRADSRQTREDILQASIRLFGDRGFSGTSMRSIADAAGVNLAAMNYHFGSKAQLFAETFQHCAAPLNAERIRKLDALEVSDDAPTVASIVRAFLDVGVIGDATWSRFVAHIFVEPDEFARPLLKKTFAPTAARFLQALSRALPHLPNAVLALRFHLVIGSMLHLVRFEAPIEFQEADGEKDNEKDGDKDSKVNNIEELVSFVVAGLSEPRVESKMEQRA